MTSVTIQSFHEDVQAAEQASAAGPVFITEDGQPKRVLIDIAEYRRLNPTSIPPSDDKRNLAEMLAMPDEDYFEWEPERLYMNLTPVEPE